MSTRHRRHETRPIWARWRRSSSPRPRGLVRAEARPDRLYRQVLLRTARPRSRGVSGRRQSRVTRGLQSAGHRTYAMATAMRPSVTSAVLDRGGLDVTDRRTSRWTPRAEDAAGASGPSTRRAAGSAGRQRCVVNRRRRMRPSSRSPSGCASGLRASCRAVDAAPGLAR